MRTFANLAGTFALCIFGMATIAAGQENPPGSAPGPVASPSPAAPEAPAKASSAVENTVVKIFSKARFPNVYKPWAKEAPSEITGSGVVIDGKRILTNAHVLAYASQIQIQANQAGDKIGAKIEAIAPGIDLALLKLDDESFFDSHPPLPIAGTLPEIKDSVMVYGYPKGGESLSITKGIVSRIEFAGYNSNVQGLRIQIDAAINPGNSGGPAVVDDKMIGLAFSHLNDAQNIGYIIPAEEIELFLKDIADGHYDGKPAIYDDFQTLENPQLRSFLKISSDTAGIIVSRPFKEEAAYPLKKWDVISKIGDTPVDDQGMVKLRPNLRVQFTYLVQKTARNGKVPLTVVRGGKPMKIELPVSAEYPLLIPSLEAEYPSYFIYGPLVFSAATTDYLSGFIKQEKGGPRLAGFSYRGSPLVNQMGAKPASPGQQLVLVSSPFFPHKLSQGYSNHMASVLKSVNGVAVKNLQHLVQLLRDSKEEFVTFEFFERGEESLVFRRADIEAATEEILSDNGVRTQGSPEALAVWNEKAKPQQQAKN